MTDRLAEIEAAASAGHHPWWDTGQAPWDLAALVGVVKAARGVTRPEPLDGVMYCGVCGTYVNRCSCPVAPLRAAIANFEGGHDVSDEPYPGGARDGR